MSMNLSRFVFDFDEAGTPLRSSLLIDRYNELAVENGVKDPVVLSGPFRFTTLSAFLYITNGEHISNFELQELADLVDL